MAVFNTPRPRVLLIIANLSFIIIGMPQAVLNVAWIHMQDTFALPLDALGVLLAVGTTGRLIGSFFSGRISAWMGTGWFIIGGGLLSILGLIGYTLSPTWPMLVLSGFVWGFGNVGINNGVNAFVAARYSTSRLNWLHAWFGVGATIAPSLATLIIIRLGADWRWSYAVLLGLYTFITLLFALTMRDWYVEPKDARGRERSTNQATMKETFRLSALWFGMALTFLHAGLQIGGGQLNSSLFIDGRAFDPLIVGTWITVYWGSFTACRFLIGFFADRIPTYWLLRAGMFLTIIASAMIWLNLSPIFSFTGLALLGFSLAPVMPTLIADTPKRVGAAHTPNTIGFQFASGALGSAILPGLGAWMGEHVSMETIPVYLLVLAVASFIVHEGLVLYEHRQLVRANQTA